MQKTYFLYINRSKTIIELDKGDLATVMEFCSKQMRANASINMMVSESQRRLNASEKAKHEVYPHLKQDLVWMRLIDHFKS